MARPSVLAPALDAPLFQDAPVLLTPMAAGDVVKLVLREGVVTVFCNNLEQGTGDAKPLLGGARWPWIVLCTAFWCHAVMYLGLG